jgi:hypothetical protein
MYDDDRHYDKYNYWEFETSPETLDYTVTVHVGYEIDHEDGKKFPILDHAYILDMNGKEIEYILSNTESERVIDELYEAIYADPRDEPDYYY